MGELPSWREQPSSNVNKGGIFRRDGDNEPVLGPGLSEAELEVRVENEKQNQRELEILKGLLMKKGWQAEDVWDSKKAQDILERELPDAPVFRYSQFKTHLKTLVAKDRSPRRFN